MPVVGIYGIPEAFQRVYRKFVDLFKPNDLYAKSYLERENVIIFEEVTAGEEELVLQNYIEQQVIETGKTEEEIIQEVSQKFKVYKLKVQELQQTFIPVTT